MATNNASGSYSGTGFTVSVTVCNLDTDLTIVDYLPFFNGVPGNPNLFTKTSPTVLTYIGASLGAVTTIIIQRRTPNITRTGLVTFASRFSSDAWNKEVDRTVRHSEEYALNGIGPGSVVIAPIPQDTAYPTGWFGDTTYSATRNALYNILSTLSPLASPTFTGNPVVPTQALNDNTTKIANTGFVINQLAGYATLGSPSFTGNPTVLTQALNDNTTKIANTAFVTNQLALYAPLASPVLTGTPTLPTGTIAVTQVVADNTTKLATTAFVSVSNRPAFDANEPTGGQVLSPATYTILTMSAKPLDTNSAFAAGAFTVPTGMGGLYSFSGGVSVTTAVSLLALDLHVNGTLTRRMALLQAATDTFSSVVGSTVLRLSAGDIVTVRAYQSNSGATTKTILGSAAFTFISGYRLNT